MSLTYSFCRNCRKCRSGAGYESDPGMSNTPGFPLQDKHCLEKTSGNFKKLLLKRNHPRMVQTSTDMLRSWRGNCDIQILIYESDPKFPNLREIAKVTDRIIKNSEKSRSGYLAHMEASFRDGPRRKFLSEGNLAHASAACPLHEKTEILGAKWGMRSTIVP